MVLRLPWAQKRMSWAFGKSIFQFFTFFWLKKLKPFSGKLRQCCENFFHKVCFVGSFLENAFQSWFDDFRQLLLEFLNISNILNVTIWIFNWSYSNFKIAMWKHSLVGKYLFKVPIKLLLLCQWIFFLVPVFWHWKTLTSEAHLFLSTRTSKWIVKNKLKNFGKLNKTEFIFIYDNFLIM